MRLCVVLYLIHFKFSFTLLSFYTLPFRLDYFSVTITTRSLLIKLILLECDAKI